MNFNILSQLYFKCPYCDLKYFSTSHLIKSIYNDRSRKICKLCNEEVDPENITLTTNLSNFNNSIEIIFPRGIEEYDIGNNEYLKLIRYNPDITYSYFMKHSILRLKKRTRYGEWKVKHYKNRIKILSKALSIYLSQCLIKNILEYLNCTEQTILFREIISYSVIK